MNADALSENRWPETSPGPRPRPADPVPGTGGSLLALWGWFIAGACSLNFLLPPTIEAVVPSDPAQLLVGTYVGTIVAQIMLLSSWIVWAPGSFPRRLLYHWVVAVGLYVSWCLGMLASLHDEFQGNGMLKFWGQTLCALPLVSLAAQLPMWPLRTHFRWRIEIPSHNTSGEGSLPLSIRDVMIGTVLTAIAFAAIRLLPRPYWFTSGIGAAAIAAASLVFLLPALSIILRAKDSQSAIAWWILYVASGWFATLAIVSVSGGSIEAELAVILLSLFGSCGAAIAAPLFAVRAFGYRLTGPRDRQVIATAKATGTPCESPFA